LDILWLPRFVLANVLTGNPTFIARLLAFLLLGVVIRLMISTKKVYRGVSIGIVTGWIVCEIFTDIGVSSVDLGTPLFGYVFYGAQFFLLGGIGFFVCHTVCLILHRRKLIL
jgi:hypothetical protein